MKPIVRRLLAGVSVALAALVSASVVLGAEIGANDDTGKYSPDGGEVFYARMAELGLRQTVISVRWTPSDPETIQHREYLDRVIPVAQRHGLKVVLTIYPYPPRELLLPGRAHPWRFASYVQRVAAHYPQVRQFVIGNEPNQPAFWRPQFSRRSGENVSARTFGAYLAAAYDALKELDPTLEVIGVGLSPRGNDRRRATSNASTSPMRFLAALGRWYRASGRARPLMDGFSFHPYPNQATDSLELGYPWPHAGFVNLARIKQALWDAFDGTAQPTTLQGLKLYLDEVGWQVDTSGLPGYQGAETVAVTDELTQARIYTDLVRRAQCDPDVAQVNLFGFYDDSTRGGFQAALHHADGTPRPAAAGVARVIAEGAGACTAAATPWQPARTVVGAVRPQVVARQDALTVRVRSGEGVDVVACVFPRGTATPDAIRRLARRGAGAIAGAIACAPATGTPQHPARVTLPRVSALARGGTIAVRLQAQANSARTVSYATPFRWRP